MNTYICKFESLFEEICCVCVASSIDEVKNNLLQSRYKRINDWKITEVPTNITSLITVVDNQKDYFPSS